MVEFKKITIEDIPILEQYFAKQCTKICDFTVGGAYMWREYFDMRYAIVNDTLIMKLKNPETEGEYFHFPIGEDKDNALNIIEAYCKDKGKSITFCTVINKQLDMLRDRFGELDVSSDRDWFDYLYNSSDIKELKGRKYSTPRNHINKFNREYEKYSFRDIDCTNVDDIIEFYTQLMEDNPSEDVLRNVESQRTLEVLKEYDELGFIGSALYIDDVIVGFAIGEVVCDTLFIHIEKADKNYLGIYQKMTNLFLDKYVVDGIDYVNREEDVGDPGLRHSKLSYRPVEIIEKHTVSIL